MVGRLNRWRRRVVVVDVTDTGVPPGIGSRLRRAAIRLLTGAGVAVALWLLGAILFGSPAASAAEPSSSVSSSSGPDLLGTLAGSVTNTLTTTLTGVVGGSGVGNTLATVVGSVTPTTSSTVADLSRTVTTVPTALPTALPTTLPKTLTGTVGPVTSTVTRAPSTSVVAVPGQNTPATQPYQPVRTAPVVRHPAAPVASPVTTVAAPPIAPKHATAAVTGGRPSAPLPVPAPQPGPALPATSVTSGHGVDSQARYAVAAYLADPHPVAATCAGGWCADPATLAARGQVLPTTSPD